MLCFNTLLAFRNVLLKRFMLVVRHPDSRLHQGRPPIRDLRHSIDLMQLS